MSSAALFALLLAADPSPQRLFDDANLTVVAERSVELGERLRAELTDAKAALKPRAEALLVDARRDLTRLSRGGAITPVDEATVLFNYGETCKLAADAFGAEKVTFKPNPRRANYIEDAAKIGLIKVNRMAFAETMQNPDEIVATLAKARAALKALKEKPRRDSLQTGKWQRDLAKLDKDLNQAESDLKQPGVLNKVAAEAAVYGLYGRFVGVASASDR